MTRDLRFEAVYPFTPEQVWKALTDRQALAEWLMPNTFEPRLGHKFQFHSSTGEFAGVIECEVLELSPPRYLAYSWRGGNQDTVVSFTLQPVAEGTRVVLEHRGFVFTEGTMAKNLLSSGWEKKIKTMLPEFIDRMSGGGRRMGAQNRASELKELISRYEQGGAALEEALGALPDSEINREMPGGAWNAQQIALHIVDAEIVGAGRLRMLAAQPGALLKSYKGDIWADKLGYTYLSLAPALGLFRALRQTTSELLQSLPAEAWTNRGMHEETGEITLENLLQAHCQHAEAHIKEIMELSERLTQRA